MKILTLVGMVSILSVAAACSSKDTGGEGGAGGSGGSAPDPAVVAACNSACTDLVPTDCTDACTAVCSDANCTGVFPASDFDNSTEIQCSAQFVNFIGDGSTSACQIP